MQIEHFSRKISGIGDVNRNILKVLVVNQRIVPLSGVYMRFYGSAVITLLFY